MDKSIHARAAELMAADVPAASVGWFAHRAASSRALALLDVIAERSGDPKWLAAAGYERGTRATTPEEARRAASQLATAVRSAPLPAQYPQLLAELLVSLRDDAEIARLLADSSLRALSETRLRMLDADLANPFRTPGLSEARWLGLIQPLFGDLAPITLGPPQEREGFEPIDRLSTQLEPATVSGDLVTVIMSSYRPGPALETAVRSILSQTWANLEVLVIDDASGADFSDIYDGLEALDERVRVIHQPQNGGTYVARNTAIDQARGSYVTFQDADDWSHPERIEREVAVLESDPLVHSVRARSLRTTGSLVFSRQGTAVLAPGAVTLLFRREQVWPVLGSFDAVRKAADTEFHERISIAIPGYGVDLPQPLLWYRLGEDSLSRNEFRAGWRHPARFLYHSARASWHEEIRLGASPRLDRSLRKFPTPRRFSLDQSAPPASFDLIVLGDWRGNGGAARDAVEWIEILAADGVRIALVHAERLNFDGRRGVSLMSSVQKLVAAGTIDAIAWDEPSETNAIVAIEPEVLEFLPDARPGARTSKVVVLTDDSELTARATRETEATVAELWASNVIWSPRGELPTSPRPGTTVLGQPLPAVVPGKSRRPLHRPDPVVVVVPLGIAREVLDEAVAVGSALADAGLDVRIRLADALRQVVRRRAATVSPRIFWASPTMGAAAAELAIATDLVIVGSPVGTEYERLVDDACVWGVRTHLRAAGATVTRASDSELIDRIRHASPIAHPRHDPQSRAAAENAVRSWYENLTRLRKDAS